VITQSPPLYPKQPLIYQFDKPQINPIFLKRPAAAYHLPPTFVRLKIQDVEWAALGASNFQKKRQKKLPRLFGGPKRVFKFPPNPRSVF